MTIRDLEIDILRWDWVTEIRVTEVIKFTVHFYS